MSTNNESANRSHGHDTDLTESAKRGAQALKEKSQHLAHKASNKAEEAWDDVKDKAQNLADKASNKIYETWDDVKDKAQDLKDKACDAQATLTSYVKRNPLKSVAWAAVAGAIIGSLLRK